MSPERTAQIPGPRPRPLRDRLSVVVLLLLIAGAAAGLRLLFSPQFDGIDDLAYLTAAKAVGDGNPPDVRSISLRVGMSHPLGWLLGAGWLEPGNYWVLTVGADLAALLCLFAVAARLFGAGAGLVTAFLYAQYPLVVTQAGFFLPTSFQLASLSLSLLLLTFADGGGRARLHVLSGLAGLSLGLGYLFKEDMALVVPVLTVAALGLRWRSLTSVVVFATGAAVVFGLEFAYYFKVTGDAFYRFTVAGGYTPASEQVNEQMHIAAIWKWHAYLRSLFVMPYTVGLFWWFGAVALIAALYRGSRIVRAFAVSLVVLGLYLQFGSRSLTTYVPLPKAPRYTAIVTPFLFLLLGWWMSSLWQTGRRRIAGASAALLSATSAVCLLYAAVTANERMRNTLAVVPVLRERGITALYTDSYSARTLRLMAADPFQAKPLFRNRPVDGRLELAVPPESLTRHYVLVDHQACKIYTSTYEWKLPARVIGPPATWQPVWSHQAYPEGSLARILLTALRTANRRLPSNAITKRIERNIADAIDGDRGVLYLVTAPHARLE